jgi:hypothetical protein
LLNFQLAIFPLAGKIQLAGSLGLIDTVSDLVELGLKGEEMTDDDPNEAYVVVPVEPGPNGPPKGWWTVKRNGIAVRHFPGKENAQRYATDPEYRASLVAKKAWLKAQGK